MKTWILMNRLPGLAKVQSLAMSQAFKESGSSAHYESASSYQFNSAIKSSHPAPALLLALLARATPPPSAIAIAHGPAAIRHGLNPH